MMAWWGVSELVRCCLQKYKLGDQTVNCTYNLQQFKYCDGYLQYYDITISREKSVEECTSDFWRFDRGGNSELRRRKLPGYGEGSSLDPRCEYFHFLLKTPSLMEVEHLFDIFWKLGKNFNINTKFPSGYSWLQCAVHMHGYKWRRKFLGHLKSSRPRLGGGVLG